MDKWNPEELHRILSPRLGAEELRAVTFYVGIDYDDFIGDSKSARLRELILYLDRRRRISQLVDWIKDNRSDIDLEPARGTETPVPIPGNSPTGRGPSSGRSLLWLLAGCAITVVALALMTIVAIPVRSLVDTWQARSSSSSSVPTSITATVSRSLAIATTTQSSNPPSTATARAINQPVPTPTYTPTDIPSDARTPVAVTMTAPSKAIQPNQTVPTIAPPTAVPPTRSPAPTSSPTPMPPPAPAVQSEREKAQDAYNRGDTLLAKQQGEEYAKAVAEYELAIRYYPNFAAAYYKLGNAYRFKSSPDIDKAINNYRRAIELKSYFEPDGNFLADAIFSLAQVYRETKQECQPAITYYRQMLELPLRDLEEARGRSPHLLPIAHFGRGVCYFTAKEFTNAVKDYSAALEKYGSDSSPKDRAKVYYYRGAARFCNGEESAALADYEDAVKLDNTYQKDQYVYERSGCPK